MNTIKSYEAIARDAGYEVVKVELADEWFWCNDEQERVSKRNYGSELDAWRAACLVNMLLEE